MSRAIKHMKPTRAAQLVERLHTAPCPHGVPDFGSDDEAVTISPQVDCRPCLVAAIEAVVREDAAIAAHHVNGTGPLRKQIARAIRTRWGIRT